MSKKLWSLVAACAALALGGWAADSAGASTHHSSGGKQLVIGLSIEKTGILSVVGPTAVGAQKALAYVNSHGGVFGHPVKLDTLDNASDASKTIQTVEQLAHSGASIILGGAYSNDCYALAATVAKLQVPDICLAPDNLQKPAPPFQYGIGPASSQYDAGVYKYFVSHGDTNAGALITNDVQGQISTASAHAAEKANHGLKVDLQSTTTSATNATAQLNQMIAAKVQAIYMTTCGGIAITAAQEAISLGFKGPIMLNDCFVSSEVAKSMKSFVNGKVMVLSVEATLGPPYTPKRKSADALYHKLVGADSTLYTDGWDSVMLAVAAAKKANSTDPKVINNTLQNHFTFYGTWAGGTFTPTDHRGQVTTGVMVPAVYTKQGTIVRAKK